MSEVKKKIEKILNFYNSANYQKVIELSELFLRKNPESDFVLNILGLTYQKKQNFDKAEKIFFLGHQVNTNNISIINNLANNFKYKYAFSKAKEFYNLALSKNPKNTSTLLNFGNLEFLLNNNEKALELLKEALNTNNKLIPIHLNLAITYQSLGNFEKAKEHLKKITQIDVNFTRADKMLSALIDYKENEEHLGEMLKKINNENLNASQKIYLYFGISKAFEDQGKYEEASKYIHQGNLLKRKNSSYDINNDITKIKKIKKEFESFGFNKEKYSSSLEPIFIVGMPRSGTTLVEQIISSHKNVRGLGELNYFNKAADYEFNYSKENKPENNKFSNIIEKFDTYLNNFNFSEKKFTDKTLLNFFWIGVMKECYPNAKVINCKRNPKDNCLSIYKNLFDYEGGWCYDATELEKYYKLYQEIIKFWNERLPNFIFEVQYEELVKNPETQIKELIKFCDIEWDKNCLNYYQNKTAIKTLSVNQARKKIYSSSVGSFNNYKSFYKDFFKDL